MKKKGRNRNFIPQVDGTVDSRGSLDQTPGSIDLTESPVKHTCTQRHIEKIYEDTSDDATDETITFDEDKVKKTYRKDINALRKKANTVKTKNYKNVYYKYRKKEIIETKKRKSITECKR